MLSATPKLMAPLPTHGMALLYKDHNTKNDMPAENLLTDDVLIANSGSQAASLDKTVAPHPMKLKHKTQSFL